MHLTISDFLQLVDLLHSLVSNVAIYAYLYVIMIVGDIHDCVSTPMVYAFIYEVLYDLILEVSIHKK